MGSLISVLGNSSRALFQAVLGAQPRLTLVTNGRLARLTSLLALFSKSDEASESLLAEKFSQLQFQGDLSDYEARAMDRLRDIMALRSLAFARTSQGKNRLRQGFVNRAGHNFPGADEGSFGLRFDTQDITESATVVAKLYWKLYETCLGSIPELQGVGLQLYFHLFGTPFKADVARVRITQLTDSLQRDLGVPFLMLNLLRQGAVQEAREIGRHILTEGLELEDEDRASALYWLAEILWFSNAWANEKLSHETTLRYLYHLCFTSPDRAGFLEIDSQFFSEFEAVSELAHEALTYRETLMRGLLDLWEIFEGDFDSVFQSAMETLVGRTSKIHDHRSAWEKLWKRSQEAFSRDYLFVVEGNLCYASGNFADAAECFETALQLTPGLRPALLNLAFTYARMNRKVDLDRLSTRILADKSLGASALYVLGDAHLLLGDELAADEYYETLRSLAGWETKVDYYKSTFCYQNGMTEQALRFARAAHALNPGDTSVAYHLSLCLESSGDKDQALETLKGISMHSELDWLHYYRFTLERDLGNHPEATATLLKISTEYFQDAEQWDAAIAYARARQDIGLMRHLKKKKLSDV
jgi:tetratricopeptide (TPR) repeat protein